jgi:hypothetical protein
MSGKTAKLTKQIISLAISNLLIITPLVGAFAQNGVAGANAQPLSDTEARMKAMVVNPYLTGRDEPAPAITPNQEVPISSIFPTLGALKAAISKNVLDEMTEHLSVSIDMSNGEHITLTPANLSSYDLEALQRDATTKVELNAHELTGISGDIIYVLSKAQSPMMVLQALNAYSVFSFTENFLIEMGLTPEAASNKMRPYIERLNAFRIDDINKERLDAFSARISNEVTQLICDILLVRSFNDAQSRLATMYDDVKQAFREGEGVDLGDTINALKVLDEYLNSKKIEMLGAVLSDEKANRFLRVLLSPISDGVDYLKGANSPMAKHVKDGVFPTRLLTIGIAYTIASWYDARTQGKEFIFDGELLDNDTRARLITAMDMFYRMEEFRGLLDPAGFIPAHAISEFVHNGKLAASELYGIKYYKSLALDSLFGLSIGAGFLGGMTGALLFAASSGAFMGIQTADMIDNWDGMTYNQKLFGVMCLLMFFAGSVHGSVAISRVRPQGAVAQPDTPMNVSPEPPTNTPNNVLPFRRPGENPAFRYGARVADDVAGLPPAVSQGLPGERPGPTIVGETSTGHTGMGEPPAGPRVEASTRGGITSARRPTVTQRFLNGITSLLRKANEWMLHGSKKAPPGQSIGHDSKTPSRIAEKPVKPAKPPEPTVVSKIIPSEVDYVNSTPIFKNGGVVGVENSGEIYMFTTEFPGGSFEVGGRSVDFVVYHSYGCSSQVRIFGTEINADILSQIRTSILQRIGRNIKIQSLPEQPSFPPHDNSFSLKLNGIELRSGRTPTLGEIGDAIAKALNNGNF